MRHEGKRGGVDSRQTHMHFYNFYLIGILDCKHNISHDKRYVMQITHYILIIKILQGIQKELQIKNFGSLT